VALTDAFPAERCDDPAIIQAASELVRTINGRLDPSIQKSLMGWIKSSNDEISLCAATACVEATQDDPSGRDIVSAAIRTRWPTLLGGE